MTFQHNKFEDSPVMRSLTKIAHEKGWIKDVPVVKTAAPKLDLNPTHDLLENLLKLSNGLRHSGFDKQADEIESKFVAYKQAQSLYNTHNESGEDLVQSAHPKGSHKLLDVDSKEAVFEDILDQHMKSVDMVEKKPTGKLASSRDIVNAVKIVLADAIAAEPDYSKLNNTELELRIKDNVAGVIQIIAHIVNIAKDKITWFPDILDIQKEIVDSSKNPILDNLNDMVSQINDMENRLTPNGWFSFGLGGLTKDAWYNVKKQLDSAIESINSAIRARQTILDRGDSAPENNPGTLDAAKATAASAPSDQVIQKYKDAIDNIGIMKTILQSKNLPNSAALIGWLDQANAFANKNLDDFTKSPYKDKQEVITSFLDQVNKVLQPKLDAFKQQWSV
jgi:hypothetical protein